MPKRKKQPNSNRSMYGLLLALSNDPVVLSPLVPPTGKVLDHVINKAAGKDIPLDTDKK